MKMIAIIGAGQCDAPTAALAREVGRLLALQGVTLICGGLGGVMAAACHGAKENGGLTVGILPGGSAEAANEWVTIPIATGLGEARNVIVARAASAVIAIGGEFGTLSEMALALKSGIPVIGLGTWQLSREGKIDPAIREARTAEQAVALALTLRRRT